VPNDDEHFNPTLKLPLFANAGEANDEGQGAEEEQPYTTAASHRLRGEIKRLVYANPDGNYYVYRLTDSKGNQQTVVGNMPGLFEGQEIEAEGRWEQHQDHGRQFYVTNHKAVLPTSEMGIRKYLASGVLPGIGEVFADRIVDMFGVKTLEILDHYTERLREVPGIGAKRIQEIREAWRGQVEDRETRVFLQGLGISSAYCGRLIAKYGFGSAAEVVRRNPYRLADEVDGFGFLTSDRIASKLGISKEEPLRLCSGILYVLDMMSQDGHVCVSRGRLLESASEILDVSLPLAENGLAIALSEGKAIQAPWVDGRGQACEPRVYLRWLYASETGLAEAIRVLLRTGSSQFGVPLQYDRLGAGDARLNAVQREAVERAFRFGFSIVTGGPGVGKTTVVGQIVACAQLLGRTLLLAAPTGRAAKRLSEATGLKASTIHRLLKWDFKTRQFQHDAGNPLDCDMLIVDEASMLDTSLACSLFQAVRVGTSVVLIGDKDQLPSVGPGAVLQDLIQSRRIPVTELTEIYRQSKGSRIVANSHLVNRGIMPDLRPLPPSVLGDFYWIDQGDGVKVADMICRLVTERIPKAFGFDPMADVQVLTPMRRGDCGMYEMNRRLQAALNPAGEGKESFQVGNRMFRTGDRVMQTRNNYDKKVFNGEMGRILFVDNGSHCFTVQFDIGIVEYKHDECDQLSLAYAVTVHKSQGSEYPVVLMPVLTQHYMMLQRNLIYTGMTRSKKLLILLGTRRALGIALRNDKPMLRETGLIQRLQ